MSELSRAVTELEEQINLAVEEIEAQKGFVEYWESECALKDAACVKLNEENKKLREKLMEMNS